MIVANDQTENGLLNGVVRERTKGGEGVCNSIGRTISTKQTPQSSQGLNHQPMSAYGGGELMVLAAYVAEDGIVWHQ